MSNFLSPLEQIKADAAERKKKELQKAEPIFLELKASLDRKDETLRSIVYLLKDLNDKLDTIISAITPAETKSAKEEKEKVAEAESGRPAAAPAENESLPEKPQGRPRKSK